MSKSRGSETRRKTKEILVRLEPAAYAKVAAAASEARLSLAEITRSRLLGLKVVTRTDAGLVNELRRQGGVVMLALRSRGMREEARAALEAIRAAIDHLGGALP